MLSAVIISVVSTVLGTFAKILQYPAIKIILSALGIILLGGLTTQAYVFLGILILLDIITGIWYSLKEGIFRSNELARMFAIKYSVYLVLLSSANIVAYIIPLMGWLAKAVIIFICVTEFTSISENLSRATGQKIPSIQDLANTLNNKKK